MKKLMIAAVIGCAAAMSQAATFDWATSSNQWAPNIDLGNLTEGHVGNSNSTKLMDMTAVTWSFSMSLDNGTIKDDSIKDHALAYNQLGKIQVSGLESNAVFAPTRTEDPDNVVAYKIIIKGTYTDTGSGKVWTITSDDIASSESFSSMATPPLKINSANVTGWTVSTSAVPEPTSGLLLLLGMAGLALKRKRA